MWLWCPVIKLLKTVREILQLRLSVCPAKPSTLVHAQMASGHTRVTEVTSVPTWYQAGLKLCSGVENSSSHGLAWVGAWGSWAKIKFSHNNLFEKDAQEESPLAAGDGTGWDRNEMGQEHKHSSFGAHFAQ